MNQITLPIPQPPQQAGLRRDPGQAGPQGRQDTLPPVGVSAGLTVVRDATATSFVQLLGAQGPRAAPVVEDAVTAADAASKDLPRPTGPVVPGAAPMPPPEPDGGHEDSPDIETEIAQGDAVIEHSPDNEPEIAPDDTVVGTALSLPLTQQTAVKSDRGAEPLPPLVISPLNVERPVEVRGGNNVATVVRDVSPLKPQPQTKTLAMETRQRASRLIQPVPPLPVPVRTHMLMNTPAQGSPEMAKLPLASPAPPPEAPRQQVAIRAASVISSQDVVRTIVPEDSAAPGIAPPAVAKTLVLAPAASVVTHTRAAEPNPENSNGNTVRQVVIRLEPAHLGKVTVHLSQRGGDMDVRLVPEQAAAAEALKMDSASLSRVLRVAGAALENVSVQIVEPERFAPTSTSTGNGTSANFEPQAHSGSTSQGDKHANTDDRNQHRYSAATTGQTSDEAEHDGNGRVVDGAVYI